MRHIRIVERYSRQIILPEIGEKGQQALATSGVLIVGAGGLGSPAALYLAGAGVGRIGIVDHDDVDVSNLQRQILHDQSSVGRPKVTSAAMRLRGLNPEVKVEAHAARLTEANALELVSKYDVVIDGSDNFATRYIVNDACVAANKPYVYGSISRFEGQISVFNTGDAGCYRCLFPFPPSPGVVPSCAEGGVLGVLPGIIGTLQATEAIKVILGVGALLANRLLLFDALAMTFRELKFQRDPNCSVCGRQAALTYTATRMEPQAKKEVSMDEITATQLKERLDAGQDIMIVDVREPHELAICALPDAHHIPLGQVLARSGELDTGRDVVLICRSGGRSAAAIVDLYHAGYRGKLINLKGGLLAWADQVDPTMKKY